jgi:hypothetical protein
MAGFADQVKAWERKTERKMDLAVRKIALEMFRKIILKSPVDTGRFRSNWQVSIGSVPTGTQDGETFPQGDAVDVKGPIYYAKLSGGEATLFGANAGDTIYFANNLPYARRLEEGGYPDGPKVENGRSSQAPNGMVALTIQEFQSIVSRIGIELSIQ